MQGALCTPYLAIVPCLGSTDNLRRTSGSHAADPRYQVPCGRHWSCQSYPCLGGTWGVVGESSRASLITATLCRPLPLLHQRSQTARCARRYGLVQPLWFSGPRSVRRLLAHPMTIPPLLGNSCHSLTLLLLLYLPSATGLTQKKKSSPPLHQTIPLIPHPKLPQPVTACLDDTACSFSSNTNPTEALTPQRGTTSTCLFPSN